MCDIADWWATQMHTNSALKLLIQNVEIISRHIICTKYKYYYDWLNLSSAETSNQLFLKNFHFHFFLLIVFAVGTLLWTLLWALFWTLLHKHLTRWGFLLWCISIQKFISLFLFFLILLGSASHACNYVDFFIDSFCFVTIFLKSIHRSHRIKLQLKIVKTGCNLRITWLVVFKID